MDECRNRERIPCNSAPRAPLLRDELVDTSTLNPNEPYPGDPNEGRIYSLDLQKTITAEDGNPIDPNPELARILSDSSMVRRGGRFRVTPVKNFVIKLEKNASGWQGIYLPFSSAPRVARESADNHKDLLFSW